MKKFLMMAVALLLALGLSLTPAAVKADAILDFGIIAPTTGSISYAGGANPLVGARIDVDQVVGLGTPLNNLVTVPLTNFFLNFSSGNFTGSDPTHWNFGPGGTISISDGITTLLTGTFSNAIVTDIGGTFRVAIGGFTDFKNPILTNFYGLPANIPYIGNFNISFNALGDVPNPFTSTQVLSGDVTNSPVPEPATMFLLGSGLVGIGVYARRRFIK